MNKRKKQLQIIFEFTLVLSVHTPMNYCEEREDSEGKGLT
jgi:hypothetical protein